MRKLLFLGVALALVLITAGSPTDRDECCTEKTVGGVTYTFVEKEDTAAYSCLSDCVYRKKGEMGPKFCFAKGEEKVQCEDIQSPVDSAGVKGLDMSYHQEKVCGEQLQAFLSAGPNSTLTIRCCKSGANISTCVGLDCLTECGGGNITCMIPSTDMEDTKDCTDDTDAKFHIQGGSCAMLASNKTCPKNFLDSKCACCKFPAYTNSPNQNKNCKFECRCNGICDWFDSIFTHLTSTYFVSLCKGCSKGPKCNTTDLASSAIDYYPPPPPPPPPPSPPSPDCPAVPGNCTLCEQCDYATQCVECRCDCACKYITGCTGSDAPSNQQWGTCWRDYSFCCDCPKPGQNYSIPCPDICDAGNVDSPPTGPLNTTVGTQFLQTTSTKINCTGS